MSTSKSDRDLISTATGSGVLATGQVIETVFRFFIALLLAKHLGTDNYGLYVLAISVATIAAGISNLGLDRAMVRYVAILNARSDRPGLWGAIQVGFWISTVSAAVFGVALFLGASTIATSMFNELRLVEPLRLMAILVPFLTISTTLAGIAHGFRKRGTVALAENIVQTLVRLGLYLALVQWSNLDLTNALVVFGLADIAATLTMIALLEKVAPHGKEVRETARRDTREIFAFAVPLWLSGLLRHFRRNIESLLLGALTAVTNVAVFAIAAKVNVLGRIAYLSTLAAVKPVIAELSDQGDHRGLARIYATTTRWTFAFSVPFFVIILFMREPILQVFGDDFVAGANALLILSAAELVNAGTGVCQSLIDMTGHVRLKLFNSLMWVVIQVGSGVVLIPRWGVVGAAVSGLLAITIVNVATVIQMLVLEKLWPYDRSFWKPILAGVGAAVVAWGLGASNVSGLTAVIGFGALIAVVYGGLLFAFRLEPDDRVVLDRLRMRFNLTRSRPEERTVTTP